MNVQFTLDTLSDKWDTLITMLGSEVIDVWIMDHQTAECALPSHWTIVHATDWIDEVRVLTGASAKVVI
jgi:hypothetical protein